MKLKQIHEQLQGVKKYHQLTWHELVGELAKVGIQSLGKGRFGQVFFKAGWNYVIKVFENDSAYLEYVDFCINNPNPHYPKFIKKPLNMHQFHVRTHHAEKMMQIVKIELLKPLDEPWYSLNLEKIFKLLTKQVSEIEIFNEHRNQYESYTDVNEIFNLYKRYNVEQIMSAIYKIKHYFPNYKLDLHRQNLMQRSDGTVVLSDPLYDPTSPGGMLNANMDFQNRKFGWESGPDYEQEMQQLVMNFTGIVPKHTYHSVYHNSYET